MKLFDEKEFAKLRKKIKTWIAVFVASSVTLLTAAVLSAVFYKNIGRGGAQSVSTVCVVIAACLSLIFADYTVRYKKLSSLCAAEKSELTGRVKSVSEYNVTYRALPFVQGDVLTDNNEERRIYLYEGSLQIDVRYKFDVTRNIICGYEELQ